MNSECVTKSGDVNLGDRAEGVRNRKGENVCASLQSRQKMGYVQRPWGGEIEMHLKK